MTALVKLTKGRDPREVVSEVKCKKVRVLPPIGKQKQYPPLSLTVIHAAERVAPPGQKRIEWKLMTDLPVDSLAQAVEKLGWYAMRWKIETFHRILKLGCKAEQSKLRSAEGLVKVMAIYSILSWRILWMTMLQRIDPEPSMDLALTKAEKQILERLVPTRGKVSGTKGHLVYYLSKIARLGGYLARATDPPPGNMVMWRGMSRLNDIHLGFALAANSAGH